MKPALDVVVGKLRAGVTPTVLEYGALLRESGFNQPEARGLVRRYVAALHGHPSAADQTTALLQSFSLWPD